MVPSISMYHLQFNQTSVICLHTHLNDQTVLFFTIQFSLSQLFVLSLTSSECKPFAFWRYYTSSETF